LAILRSAGFVMLDYGVGQLVQQVGAAKETPNNAGAGDGMAATG
jgi:hypothetical protein